MHYQYNWRFVRGEISQFVRLGFSLWSVYYDVDTLSLSGGTEATYLKYVSVLFSPTVGPIVMYFVQYLVPGTVVAKSIEWVRFVLQDI